MVVRQQRTYEREIMFDERKVSNRLLRQRNVTQLLTGYFKTKERYHAAISVNNCEISTSGGRNVIDALEKGFNSNLSRKKLSAPGKLCVDFI